MGPKKGNRFRARAPAIANAADELELGALAICSDHELQDLHAMVAHVRQNNEGAV
jgi:hypothetical protein